MPREDSPRGAKGNHPCRCCVCQAGPTRQTSPVRGAASCLLDVHKPDQSFDIPSFLSEWRKIPSRFSKARKQQHHAPTKSHHKSVRQPNEKSRFNS
jgi:hypothetical protein